MSLIPDRAPVHFDEAVLPATARPSVSERADSKPGGPPPVRGDSGSETFWLAFLAILRPPQRH